MTTPLKNLQNEAKKIQLTDRERAYMRAQLSEMVRRSENLSAPTHAVRTPYFFFAPRFAAALALLLVVAVGGTTTYAAQGALPGSPLYPVKIYVNENVQQVLAVSDEAKISFHTAAAQERLREAEALAIQGKLNAEAAGEIETNFTAHVEKASTLAVTLDTKDPAGAVEARTMLDSSLAAHSTILARIGDDSSDAQTREHSNSIAAKVRSRNEGTVVAVAFKATAPAPQMLESMSLMVVNEASDTSSTSDSASSSASASGRSMAKNVATTGTTSVDQSQKKIALQLQKRAAAQIEVAQKSFKNAKKILTASTSEEVRVRLADLGDQLDAGKEQVEDEEYALAQSIFTEIIRQSTELSAYIEASKRYNKDFIRWDDRSEKDDKDSAEINIQIGL